MKQVRRKNKGPGTNWYPALCFKENREREKRKRNHLVWTISFYHGSSLCQPFGEMVHNLFTTRSKFRIDWLEILRYPAFVIKRAGKTNRRLRRSSMAVWAVGPRSGGWDCKNTGILSAMRATCRGHRAASGKIFFHFVGKPPKSVAVATDSMAPCLI